MVAEGRLRALFLLAALLALTGVLSRDARATLGESATSAEADRKALSAVRGATTTAGNYTVQEMRTDAYTVREYVSPAGIVFAVAWEGLTYPDLTPLLGSYAAQYKEALRQRPRRPGRRHLTVRTDQVVVQKWGHMRDLRGRAYVPALIPPGVSIDEIK
jgi:hypothetical protein